MATISVNPERRDPGYLRKKADIGLSNVDNISATDFINVVADDVKIIGNKKINTGKFSFEGKESYVGILKTAKLNTYANFSTGLFKHEEPNKELAQFNLNLSFSTVNSYNTGSIGYTLQLPVEDPYLKDLEIVFTQVGEELYVTLYSKSFPNSTNQNFFNQIGTVINEWTEGTSLLDSSKDYIDIIKGGKELGRVKLNKPSSSAQTESGDYLSVYDENGKLIPIEPRVYTNSEMRKLDYPSINGVPFIGKKGVNIGSSTGSNARNIEITAKHSGPSKTEAGGHNWEVLNNLKISSYEVSKGPSFIPPISGGIPINLNGRFVASDSLDIENDNSDISNKYGLCKLSQFSQMNNTFTDYYSSVELVKEWLNNIGPDDTDVITVGMFRTFMSFFINQVLENMSVNNNAQVSYTPWEIETTQSITETGNVDSDVEITVTAKRNKITKYFIGDIEDESKRVTVEEIASDDQITVVSENGYNVSYSEGVWTVTIPVNNSIIDITRYITVYVDRDKTTQKSKVLSVLNKANFTFIKSTTYTIDVFDTTTTVGSISSTYDVNFSVTVSYTWSDGKITTKLYKGNEVSITCDNDDVDLSYYEEGVYKVTYPTNDQTSERTFTLTCSYKGKSETLVVTQSAASEEDSIVGNGYFLSVYPKSLSFEANPDSTQDLTISSKYKSIWSFGEQVFIKDQPYTLTCPDWISYNTVSFGQEVLTASQNTGKQRTGVITISQDVEGGKSAKIQVTQEEAVIQETVSVSSISIDTSKLPMEETTRTLYVTYKTVKTFTDGNRLITYYKGEDIDIIIEPSGAETNPVCVYNGNGSWNITFKNLPEGEKASFNIVAEYKGVRSNNIVLTQGKSLTKTSYEFEISKLTYNSLGTLSGNYVTGIPASGGQVNIEFISKAKDYYDDGTTYEYTESIPFVPTSSSSYIHMNGRGNVLSINFDESTQDTTRTANIQVKQAYSGKIISLYLSQDPIMEEYCIYINEVEYVNGDQYEISLENTSSDIVYTITPGYKINGEEQEIDYNEITVNCGSSWLQTSYSLGNLILKCPENIGGSDRTSVITIFYSKGVEVFLEVTQKAGNPYVIIEGSEGTSSYSISKSKDSQTVSLSVESNYPYTISGSSSWVSLLTGTSYSAGTSNVTFELKENSLALSRTASFTITTGIVSRNITITQTSRTYYIDVVDFENQDVHLCTSEWMKTLIIPLKFNVGFAIDYASDWLNVAIYDKTNVENPFNDDCSCFGSYLQSSGTQYLYISQKNPTAVGEEVGVISLSYYDIETNSLVAIRKIYVSNLSNKSLENIYGSYGDNYQILPIGPRNIFVPGESTKLSLYAYSKNTTYKVKVLGSSDSNLQINTIQSAVSNLPQGNKKPTSISVTIPENTTEKYRSIVYTLVPTNAITNSISNNFPTPIYYIYQYPKIDLELENTDFKVPYSGLSNLNIKATKLNSCLGHFELKTNELPGWIIPTRPIYSDNNIISFRIEPNNGLESRSISLEFWCDSDISTVKTVTITQSGTLTPSSSNKEYFDKSVIEATSTENYFYVYNVKSITERSFTLDTDGKVVDTGITVKTENTNISGKYKITYKKITENQCYDRDYLHGMLITGTDNVNRLIIFKNSRTLTTSLSINSSSVSFGGSNGSSSNIPFGIKSNVGLTSFVQGTNFNVNRYPDFCDFMTKEVSYKADNTGYMFTLHNPEKRFLKKQVMDHVIFRNMDIIPGLAKEVEITLPVLTLPERGIGVWDDSDSEIFLINTTKSEVYNIYLDSNCKDSSGKEITKKIFFKAYDGVTVSTTSSGNGFNLTCYQPEIVKKVGSLGRQNFILSAKSNNTGSSQLSLGTVKLSLSNGINKTFYIYQKANSDNLVGNTWTTGLDKITEIGRSEQCFDDDNAYIIYDTYGGEPYWDLTFQHTYQNWMITRESGNGGFMKFNDNSYSETFGDGGNSGTSLTTCDRGYTTSVKIEAPNGGYLVDSNTLEIQQHGLYRISSNYSTGNITDKESRKGYIHICTRPPIPDVSVLNSSNELVLGTNVNGTGTIQAQLTSLGENSYSLSFIFILKSNYIDITENYIGERIKVEGNYVNIETEYDIFKDLISSISFEYNYLSSSDQWSSIPLSIENFTTGVSDGHSYMQFKNTLMINSTEIINKAKLRIVIKDFVSDPEYYNPYENNTLVIPLTFNSQLM